MGLANWFKKKMAALALATANVEKNALGQGGEALSHDVNQVQRHKQGMLSDALMRAEITQEVKELRWRMYKVLEATDGVSAKIVGYDEDGYPIVEVKDNTKRPMKNVRVDAEDNYRPIMIVDNSEIMLGTSGGSDTETIDGVDGELVEDEDGDNTKTIGEISADDYHSNIKTERPINVTRTIRPKFEIEKYAKKLVVREINNVDRLLEFYVSMYPDEYDRKTRLLISEIKKAMNNPRMCDMLDIDGINYITNKTMGAKDYEFYEYIVSGFNKIVEFDGHYVIKFDATVATNGENIIEKFREIDLDVKYQNKEAK